MTGLIVRPTEIKYETLNNYRNKKKKSHLLAQWVKVDGKLICQWVSAES